MRIIFLLAYRTRAASRAPVGAGTISDFRTMFQKKKMVGLGEVFLGVYYDTE